MYTLKWLDIMKKNLIALALVAGSAFVGVANANGTITMTGSITDATCNVGTDVSMDFGTVGANGMPVVGDATGATPFQIALTGCPTDTDVAVKFSGTPDTNNGDLIATSGDAEGVAVGIYEANGTTRIPVGVESATKTVTGAASLDFIAKYVRTATVVPGDADALVDFTLVYN